MFVGQSIDVFAFNLSTGDSVSADAANISVYMDTDGAGPVILSGTVTEIDAVKSKGWYRVVLSDTERLGTKFLITAKSSTSGVRVLGGPPIFSQTTSGGGVLNARIAYSSLAPDEYLEIVQGEEKVLTFIVEADGRFDQQIADVITVKLQDPTDQSVTKGNSSIVRVTEELDIQVFRVTLTSANTLVLGSGLLRIEISFDSQKAVITHAVKMIEAL